MVKSNFCRAGRVRTRLCLLALALLIVPVRLSGHAVLIGTSPGDGAELAEPPKQVELVFNQKLEFLPDDAVQITDESGRSVASGAAYIGEDGKKVIVPLEPLRDGQYNVRYELLSMDGHMPSGEFSFDVAANGAKDMADRSNPVGSAGGTDPDRAALGGSSAAESARIGINAGGSAQGGATLADSTRGAPSFGGSGSSGMVNAHNDHETASGLPDGLPEGGPVGTAIDRLFTALTVVEVLDMLHLPFFLLLIGLVLWNMLLWGRTEEVERRHRAWTMNVLRIQLLLSIGTLAAVVMQSVGLDDLGEVRGMLLDTTSGLSRVVLIVLSTAGLFILHRWKPVDLVWLIAAIAFKTQIGHAAAAADRLLASAMAAIHLAAAAMWVGGLLLLALMWRKYRFDAEKLLPAVSGASIAAFVLLAVSGLVSSMIYLPDLSYLLMTRWGLLLLIKLLLVVVVAVLGAWIRRRFSAGGIHRVGGLLRFDIALMVVIAGLAALIAASEPVPANEPLHWHEMGLEVHMTAEITPNAPGRNLFGVTVWLEEGEESPEQVVMNLYPGQSGGEPRSIPLRPVEEGRSEYGFPGFDEYHYAAEGGQLDEPGRWRVEVIVAGPGGRTWRYEHPIRVY